MRLNKRGDSIYIERMKRLLILTAIAGIALPAAAFNPTRPNPNRVTVLQPPAYEASDVELRVAHNVRARLVSELRARGYEVVDSPMTIDDVQRTAAAVSGLYVEIAPAEVRGHAQGGVAVGTHNVGVDIGVIVSHVAADLYVYDGRSFEVIAQRHLAHDDVAVAPTGVGVGTYRMSAFFALPFIQNARYRAAAGAVVHDATEEIAKYTGR